MTIYKAISYKYIELIQMKYFIKRENKITVDKSMKPREKYKGEETQFEYVSSQFDHSFDKFVEYMLTNPCDMNECNSYPNFRLIEVETGYIGQVLNEVHIRWVDNGFEVVEVDDEEEEMNKVKLAVLKCKRTYFDIEKVIKKQKRVFYYRQLRRK